MFIPPTARYYGLQVSPDRDERLNVVAETRAAMRMFTDLRGRFGNWPLALMAYNAGAANVEGGIDATGSRDAWALGEAGFGNGPDYVSRVTAAALILANPDLAR
jgi:soluble lytic murein transglycosylase-like protein